MECKRHESSTSLIWHVLPPGIESTLLTHSHSKGKLTLASAKTNMEVISSFTYKFPQTELTESREYL